MSTACSEIIWLRGLLAELGFPQTELTSLYADNTSAIQIVANPVFHERTKHIEVDFHSIHEAYDDHVISLPHINTQFQVADIFTKVVPRSRHQFLVYKSRIRICAIIVYNALISICRGNTMNRRNQVNFRDMDHPNYRLKLCTTSLRYENPI